MTTAQNGPVVPGDIRRNWVRVAAPKNEQWTTAMDGIDKLKLVEAALPTPSDGEVLVRIDAVGISYRDVQGKFLFGVLASLALRAKGAALFYDIQADQAIVPCSDMCGTVIDASHASGGDKPLLANGDRVLAIYLQSHLSGALCEADLASGLGWPLPGVLARYRCFPAASLVRAPAHLSAAEASCLPRAAATAWTALNWPLPLLLDAGASEVRTGGDGKRTVLLQGTSAVALAGLQLAKAAGLRAVVTGPTDEFVKRAREELKADEGVNYQTHWAWEGDVLKATDGRGADVIFEMGGARTLHKSFKCVAFGGVINCVGSPPRDDNDGDDGGKTPTLHRLDVNALALARSVTIKGVLNGGRDRLQEALQFYEERGIKPVVDKTFKFGEAGEALAYVKKGRRFGTVVVTVGDEGNDGGKNKPEESEE